MRLMFSYRFLSVLIFFAVLGLFLPVAPLYAWTYTGNLYLRSQEDINNLAPGLTAVTAGLYVGRFFAVTGTEINDLSPLETLQSVGGDFQIVNNKFLTNIDGFSALTSVGGSLTISNNKSLLSINGLNSLPAVGAYLGILQNTVLPGINGFANLRTIGMDLTVSLNPALTSMNGFVSLQTISRYLSIENNDSLTEIKDFPVLTYVYHLVISTNSLLTRITGFALLNTAPSIEIFRNPLLEYFCGLLNVCQNGYNHYWSTIYNLSNPTKDQILLNCNPRGTVAGFVWHDLNRNGVHDENEPGIDNVQVNIKGLLKDGWDDSQLTSGGGQFKFRGQAAMDYRVYINKSTLPPYFQSTNGVDEITVTLEEDGYTTLNFLYAETNCDSLKLVAGSPTYPGEDWDNAVDNDTTDWDGTVTTRGPVTDLVGPAWGIFQFACEASGRFNKIAIKTDNGVDQIQQYNRQAREIQIWISTTGILDADFTLGATIAHHSRLWQIYYLPLTCEARYIKLVITTPTKANGAWRQLVEFKTMLQEAEAGDAAPAAQRMAVTELITGNSLKQNYPNPFNPVTSIGYDLAEPGAVTLKIYDINGREIVMLIDGVESAGHHVITWNAAGMPSGSYFIKISTEKFQDIKRMILLK